MKELSYAFSASKDGQEITVNTLFNVSEDLVNMIESAFGVEKVFYSGRYFVTVKKGFLFSQEDVINYITDKIEIYLIEKRIALETSMKSEK